MPFINYRKRKKQTMTNANFASKDCQNFVSMKLPSYVIPDEISYHIFLSTLIVSNRIMALDLHVFLHVLRVFFSPLFIQLRSAESNTKRTLTLIAHSHTHSRRQCFQSCLCSMLSVRCARVPLLVFFALPLHHHLTRSSNADMPCVVWSASVLRVCIAQRASYVRVQRNRTKYFISDRDTSERRGEGKWVRQANQPSPTSTKG